MSDYPNGSMVDYLEDAAAKKPAPGGGSIAAMAGAMAAAMASMVAQFTVNAKKYADVSAEVGQQLESITALREELTQLVQADVEAYSVVSNAYGMPKETDEEKSARSAAIKQACDTAMQPPLACMRAARNLAALLPRLTEIGNTNLITDAGVAAHLAQAAFESAVLNVRINLGFIGDDEKAATIRDEIDAARAEINSACEDVVKMVDAALA